MMMMAGGVCRLVVEEGRSAVRQEVNYLPKTRGQR